jgi:hypothetical protein
MVTGYIFPRFGILHQEKSGNPAFASPMAGCSISTAAVRGTAEYDKISQMKL